MQQVMCVNGQTLVENVGVFEWTWINRYDVKLLVALSQDSSGEETSTISSIDKVFYVREAGASVIRASSSRQPSAAAGHHGRSE